MSNLPSHEKIICIDIDGVIAVPNDDYSKCEVVPDARYGLARLRELGYFINLYTARHILHASATYEWLTKNGIPYDNVVFGKPPAVAYLDDNAYRFEGWDMFLGQFLGGQSCQQ